LSFYKKSELQQIVTRSASLLGIEISPEGAEELARRSRGTPRIANRLLKRVRDYAEVRGDGHIDDKLAEFALNALDVDKLGLDTMDRRILNLIHHKFDGGPVGIDTLSAALSEESDTLEEVYEPYLLQEGLINKTPRGRIITEITRKHLDQGEELES
jgi:Holliday junction DNA helicase RuvB